MIKKLSLFALSLALILLVTGDAAATAFRRKESENFILYHYVEDAAFADAVLRTLEDNCDRITTTLQVEISEKTPVYIYPDEDAMWIAAYGRSMPSWAGVNGLHRDGVIHIVSYRYYGYADYYPVLGVALHEFAHAAARQLGADSQLYLEEGLANFLAGDWEPEEVQRGIARRATSNIQNQTFPTIRRLSMLDNLEEDYYIHCYLFAKFIVEEYGFDTLMELYVMPSTLREGAIRKVFGVGVDELQDNWMRYIMDTYYIEN